MTHVQPKIARASASAIARLAGRERPSTLKTQLLDLWQSLRGAPRLSPIERQRLIAALYID